jgi:hypothetical protein
MATRRRKRASRLAKRKDLQMQAFCEAADGIRTHDLLHGKQLLLALRRGLFRSGSGFVANRPGVEDSGIPRHLPGVSGLNPD